MMEFGDRLRAARERRGISLRQVAASTKIPTASLEALERDDVARLPEGIFRRAIVRAYAAEIGLPPEETLREFLAHHEPQPAEVRPDEGDGDLIDARQRMAAVVVGVVVLSVLLAAAILLLTSRREPHVPTPAAAVSAPAPQAADDGTAGDEEHLDSPPAPVTDAPGAPPGLGEASRIE
jgi:cytoskeleton protein RodZ